MLKYHVTIKLHIKRSFFMKINEYFSGQKNGFSRSITLRNRLIPIGKTEENLKKSNILNDDFKRKQAYDEVKKIIDDFHKVFIEEVLSKANLNWEELYNIFNEFQNEKDKNLKNKIKNDLQKNQKNMRTEIVRLFKEDKRWEILFKKELLTDLLPAVIQSAKTDEITNKNEALKIFKGFATYFTGFHENRKNMYNDEEKAASISNRIVNENFPIFFNNIKVFEFLQKEFPKIITDTEESLKNILNGKKLAEIFNINAFNNVLNQKGIDFYNQIIGGISGETGTEKIQGLNEKINLTSQQLPKEEKSKLRKKMTILYKQILSDKSTSSFIPGGFENDREVFESVKEFKENIYDSIKEKISSLSEKNDYDFSKVIVLAKNLTAFSLSVFGKWNILSEGLFLLEKDKINKSLSENQIEKINKEISKKDFSFNELQNAYERWLKEYEVKSEKNINDFFKFEKESVQESTNQKTTVKFLSIIEENYSKIDFKNQKSLQYEKESAVPIKEFLDEVQSLYHYLKLVDYHGEEKIDSDFYAKLNDILEKLSEISSLYNKVRNFVTKKPSEVKKIKLNFNCPTLANGWDLNKESSNDTIILRKDGNYFLGIFNPKDKPKFAEENLTESETFYEKMVYKLLPGPNKMLPKVFFSEKGIDKYFPSEEILSGYEKGIHKKGENFNKEFMIKLIDWFKNSINSHEDWKQFNFNFSPTESYKDMSDFYKEVELQGYKISFQKISEAKINSFIDSGKLYLFQIYNKDFAEKSTGNKNLHTLYWENLFSEENLKDVVLKLNGEAELFFRPKNENLKIIKHKKDSVLVNKTTADGKSIPEEIYQEIYKFKNGLSSTISEEAKNYLEKNKVICKKANHEITKDRHFIQDTYLFHCPITMNFKAPEITGKKFNQKVFDYLKDNSDIKIIGLDRGERNLIYLSLINQKGEIKLQKSLNEIVQNRNDKTAVVNYQEKLVQKEGNRDKARKNWQTIGNIKELKEGYLSAVVHEIATLMVENNAIVVMEDLNFGFKRGRFAVERQIYQKFENMLIEKLNYLVFKNKNPLEEGGVLNAYKFTNKIEKLGEIGKQCGWIFYISAGYTSKIDPKTGFVNLFVTKGLTNVEKKKEFFDKFDSIRFDSKENCFVFGFDYDNFGNYATCRKKWEIFTHGERLVFSKSERKTVSVNPTEKLKEIFNENNINWNSEENFIDQIQEIQAERENAHFYDELLRSFNATLQMRNSIPLSTKQEDDYLISPVKADDGTFFDSRKEAAAGVKAKLPIDADANGAYHIALKGLYLLKNNFNLNEKGYIENISNAQWFEFAQNKNYLK